MKQEQPTIEGLKFCKKCGQYKPLSDFYRCSTSKDKLHFYCKQCVKKLNGEYSRQQRESIRNRIRDNQKKEPEETKEKSRTRYESNKEKLLKYSMTKYYSTDYLEKKYLKRYQASLEKVLAKKAYLENTIRWNKNPTYNMKQKMQGYESAIEKWKNKIREAEELIALYAENKTKAQEEVKLEPIQPIDTEENTIGPTEETEVPKQEPPQRRTDHDQRTTHRIAGRRARLCTNHLCGRHRQPFEPRSRMEGGCLFRLHPQPVNPDAVHYHRRQSVQPRVGQYAVHKRGSENGARGLKNHRQQPLKWMAAIHSSG